MKSLPIRKWLMLAVLLALLVAAAAACAKAGGNSSSSAVSDDDLVDDDNDTVDDDNDTTDDDSTDDDDNDDSSPADDDDDTTDDDDDDDNDDNDDSSPDDDDDDNDDDNDDNDTADDDDNDNDDNDTTDDDNDNDDNDTTDDDNDAVDDDNDTTDDDDDNDNDDNDNDDDDNDDNDDNDNDDDDNDDDDNDDDTCVYQPVVGAWTATNTPSPLVGGTSGAAVEYEGRVYIKNYWYNYNFSHNVDVGDISLDGELTNWETTSSSIYFNYDGTLIIHGGYMYSFGGGDAGCWRKNAVERAPVQADGTLGAWVACTSMPYYIRGSLEYVIDNNLYVVGTYTGADCSTRDAIKPPPIMVGTFQASGDIAWTSLTDVLPMDAIIDNVASVSFQMGRDIYMLMTNGDPPEGCQWDYICDLNRVYHWVRLHIDAAGGATAFDLGDQLSELPRSYYDSQPSTMGWWRPRVWQDWILFVGPKRDWNAWGHGLGDDMNNWLDVWATQRVDLNTFAPLIHVAHIAVGNNPDADRLLLAGDTSGVYAAIVQETSITLAGCSGGWPSPTNAAYYAPLDEECIPVGTAGACCPNDGGSCANTYWGSCYGIWEGAGTDCGSFDCTLGACCTPNGKCTDTHQADCTKGQWGGAGHVCENDVYACPAIGACCLSGGGCQNKAKDNCTNGGGTYKGDTTDCASTSC